MAIVGKNAHKIHILVHQIAAISHIGHRLLGGETALSELCSTIVGVLALRGLVDAHRQAIAPGGSVVVFHTKRESVNIQQADAIIYHWECATSIFKMVSNIY